MREERDSVRVVHRVSFPGLKEFEQYTTEFTLEAVDIAPESVVGCDLLERFFFFFTLVLYQGIFVQFSKGYISREDFLAQKERLFGLLPKKLNLVVSKIMEKVVENGQTAGV